MDYSGKIITKNPVEPSQTSAPGVWTLDQATQAVQGNNWPIAYVPNPISRSLRFNSADTTYLSKTPASAGNRKTWTWSGWVKRSGVSANQTILQAYNGNADGTLTAIIFESGDVINVLWWNYYVKTTAVFRDPSAWYHVVVAVDTTQATDTNRVKIYVNGVQQTIGAVSWPTQNLDGGVNNTISHQIGYSNNFAYGFPGLTGYLTEVNFIDGQALDPTYFGMTDPRTGAWIPKKYSGTYGTNGFYLNFSDNSSTAALGTDYSGNSNTWTTNNFSVTAGSGNDSMVDVPTPWAPYNTTGDIGGVVRGNYATLNPLAKFRNGTSFFTAGDLSNGNLQVTLNADNEFSIATWNGQSGKWYSEFTVTNLAQRASIGVLSDSFDAGTVQNTRSDAGGSVTGDQSWTTGDVIQIAIDYDNSKVWFGKNNTWYNSGNPATNTNGTSLSFTVSGIACWQVSTSTGNTVLQFNAGQRPFAYTPPAGFKSLCTTNLPEPTILDGGDYFNAVLYTGNGGTQTVSGVGFQPDLVWIKNRQTTNAHKLVDAVRGAGISLSSNSTDAEGNESLYFTNFTSDGFDLALGGGGYNAAYNYVSWNWKESATSGFDIVTYTGDGTSNRTINHNLGVAPYMIITKQRNGTNPWLVQFNASTNTGQYLYLNSTAGYATYAGYFLAATSTTYGWGTSDPGGNGNGLTYVSYLFAAVPGFSAFGSYTGNGSADGPFVYCGFRPRYVMVKGSSFVSNWLVLDTARSSYNLSNLVLRPNLSNAEYNSTTEAAGIAIDILSNGFKFRADYADSNTNGATLIYAAFAENPFKYSTAR